MWGGGGGGGGVGWGGGGGGGGGGLTFLMWSKLTEYFDLYDYFRFPYLYYSIGNNASHSCTVAILYSQITTGTQRLHNVNILSNNKIKYMEVVW